MLKRIVCKAAIALVALLTTIDVAVAASEPMVVKLSHVVTNEAPKGIGALALKQCVEKRLPDQVVVQIYPDSQLYSDGKVIGALIRGDVQLAAPSLSQFVKYSKKFALYDLPFLFDDIQAVDRFQNSDKGREILRSLESKGLMGLAYWHNGMKQLSAQRPLNDPAAARDLKFRIQPSEVLFEQFSAINAYPIRRPFSEVRLLLWAHAIDGTENPWSNTWSQGFHEYQSYITETDHGILDYLLVASGKWWSGLSENTRAVFTACAADATLAANEAARREALASRQKVLDSGKTRLVSLSPAERARWREVMKPVWTKFESKIGKDLIDAALASNSH